LPTILKYNLEHRYILCIKQETGNRKEEIRNRRGETGQRTRDSGRKAEGRKEEIKNKD